MSHVLYPPDPWLDHYGEQHSVAVRAMRRDLAERNGGEPLAWDVEPKLRNPRLTDECDDGQHHQCGAHERLFTSWGQRRCWCLCHYRGGNLQDYEHQRQLALTRGSGAAMELRDQDRHLTMVLGGLHECASDCPRFDLEQLQSLDSQLADSALWQRHLAGDR